MSACTSCEQKSTVLLFHPLVADRSCIAAPSEHCGVHPLHGLRLQLALQLASSAAVLLNNCMCLTDSLAVNCRRPPPHARYAHISIKSVQNSGQNVARNLRACLHYQNIAPKLSPKLFVKRLLRNERSERVCRGSELRHHPRPCISAPWPGSRGRAPPTAPSPSTEQRRAS